MIGINNQLPWHLPEDLKHFKNTTLGHTLIMGRKTFDSIGKPLPGRRTIVVSRQAGKTIDGCEVTNSLAQAIELSQSTPERKAFIVGGSSIYQQALNDKLAKELIITEVDLAPHGDAYFPAIDPTHWNETSRDHYVSANGTKFAVVRLQSNS